MLQTHFESCLWKNVSYCSSRQEEILAAAYFTLKFNAILRAYKGRMLKKKRPLKKQKQHETGQTVNKESKNGEKIQRKQASH